jgi:hypothetical protein
MFDNFLGKHNFFLAGLRNRMAADMTWFRRNHTYIILVKGSDERWLQYTAIVAKTPQQAMGQIQMSGTFSAVDAEAWGKTYEV